MSPAAALWRSFRAEIIHSRVIRVNRTCVVGFVGLPSERKSALLPWFGERVRREGGAVVGGRRREGERAFLPCFRERVRREGGILLATATWAISIAEAGAYQHQVPET